MSKTTKKKSPQRVRLSDNLNYVLAAFAVAFVAWVFAKSGQTLESRVVVPVLLKNVDPRIEARVTPESVPVVMRYASDLQGYINSENFHFEVDGSDLRQGLGLEWKTKSLALTEKNWVSHLPRRRRVSLLRIGASGNTVEIRARWRAQAAVVEADVVGTADLPEGLQLAGVRVTPREVWVAGNDAALAGLARDEATGRLRLLTERVNVANRTQGAIENVGIRLPAGVEIVQPPTAFAEVYLDIQEVVSIRELRDVPLQFEAVSPDTIRLEYTATTATVTVRGPQSLLKQLGTESIEVRLVRPPEELPGATREVPVEARFSRMVPDDVRARLSIQSVEPKTIKVRYAQKAEPPAQRSTPPADTPDQPDTRN